MKIGLLPLGRPTFDVEFAQDNLASMLDALEQTGHEFEGSRDLLFDADATGQATNELAAAEIDRLLILQVTFTDAVMTKRAALSVDCPVLIWAIPEPRIGGRLRLNSFCGLNLASHALGLIGRRPLWHYAAPGNTSAEELTDWLEKDRPADPPAASETASQDLAAGQAVLKAITGKSIARLGDHPDGFDTCAYDRETLKSLTGISVDALELQKLFDTASNVSPEAVEPVRSQAQRDVGGLDAVDAEQLDRSLRLKVALDDIASGGGYDAFAIRCWPETFTEYGGAVCGPVAMLGEKRTPCACEADVYGAVSQLILQQVADDSVFLVDLVDMDRADGTGVVWHCGQAPVSMRDPDAEPKATIHTNRKMPLLYEFPLKPGPVTLMRLSQAQGETKIVLAKGEMQRRPMAFTGTSGVLTFDNGVAQVLDSVIESGLEHHMALAYGDHVAHVKSVAAALQLPVLEL